MFRLLALRGQLKDLAKNGLPFGLTLTSFEGSSYIVARVTKVGLLSIDFDILEDDLHTVVQSATTHISDVSAIRTLAIENIRISLILNNPDLLLGDEDMDCDDDECECVEEEEDQE